MHAFFVMETREMAIMFCVESYGKKKYSSPFFLTNFMETSLYNDYEKDESHAI